MVTLSLYSHLKETLKNVLFCIESLLLYLYAEHTNKLLEHFTSKLAPLEEIQEKLNFRKFKENSNHKKEKEFTLDFKN